MFYKRLFDVNGNTNGIFRMAIHPPHDPDEALADQIEMIKYLKEKESYEFIKYSDLLGLDQEKPLRKFACGMFNQTVHNFIKKIFKHETKEISRAPQPKLKCLNCLNLLIATIFSNT